MRENRKLYINYQTNCQYLIENNGLVRKIIADWLVWINKDGWFYF